MKPLSSRRSAPSIATLCALLCAASLLSGCGIGSAGSRETLGATSSSAPVIKGLVHGGQQPVSGATIQLYTVGTTGVGSSATPLIGSTVTSASDGTFSITGKYSCASATQVYIVASGGNAGSGSNAALSLMTALGPCSSLSSSTFISINELTTAAAAYALAPFTGASYTKIGATGSNPSGLVSAFSTAQMLVSSATGTLASNTNFTIPSTELNTLANILAACVNTSGATSAACTTLLSATGAADTIGAATAIAKSPSASAITALWSLPTGTPPFQPGLSAAPNDFTVALTYTGSEIAAPQNIAIDASGNAWITLNYSGKVVKAPPFSTGSYSTATYAPSGVGNLGQLSIDRSGNVWFTDLFGSQVVELNASGTQVAGSPYTSGVSYPLAIATDSAGNAWVTNSNSANLTKLSPSGAATTYSNTALMKAASVAIDSTGRVLVGSKGAASVCIFANTGTLQGCYTDNALLQQASLAVTPGGNIYVSGYTGGNTYTGAFSELTTTGTFLTSAPATSNGLGLSSQVAVDGAGNAWFGGPASIAEFAGSNPLSGTNGFGSFTLPVGIAIDASGNVWVADQGANTLSILVGAATPVTTPLAANVGP